MAANPTLSRDELRFAVVLNGGVSLAVWIGGVTLEIDRLTRKDRVYGHLQRLLNLDARADVITGTSAGGINGAALALAQVNDRADLRTLRDLWADQGRMETLLRTPFRGEPSSLLKGDDYFLPALEQALRGLADRHYAPYGPERRPVHLGITSTLLEGVRMLQSDALGQALPQEMHSGLMTFQHLEDGGRDDFAVAGIAETVRRLALAARTSASFPVAFEPSFLPNGATAPDPLERPDMSPVAAWRDPLGPPDQSRYALDGGAMMNTPTAPALDAIERLPAKAAVRRVMLVVFPHAPVDFVREHDRVDDPPTVVETLLAASHASRNEASRTHVELVERHNRKAAERRTGRADALVSLETAAGEGGLVEDVALLAGGLYPHYRELRMRRAARDLAGRVPPVEGWSYDRVLAAVDAEQREFDALIGVPYLAAPRDWAFSPDGGWPWGVTTAEHVLDDAQDLARRLVRLPLPDGDRARVERQRATLFEVQARLRDVRATFDGVWLQPPFAGQEPDAAYWRTRLLAQRRAYLGDVSVVETRESDDPPPPYAGLLDQMFAPGQSGRRVGAALALLAGAVTVLGPVLEQAVDLVADDHERRILRAWQQLLAGAPDRSEIVTRLVRLDVVISCLTNAPETGSQQVVELVQVSLQTENAFARRTTRPGDKLGGARLNRFAGFLKESWRINDWMWGRLDAATMLCRVLLDPERLRLAVVRDPAVPPRTQAERWLNDQVATLFPDLAAVTGLKALVDAATTELETYVFAPTAPDLPPTLENLAAVYAWAIQADIASEDLPALRDAIKADRRDGAVQGSAGERLVDEHAALLDHLKALPPLPLAGNDDEPPVSERLTDADAERRRLGVQALVAFDAAGVGQEAIEKEASGDLLIRTGFSAVAVAATVLDSPKLGLKLVRPVTRTIRGLALLPYWVARGLTSAGRIAQTLALTALAVGAAMLGLSLLLPSTPRWVALVGLSAVLFALGYAALRTGSLLHGLVLLAPAVPLVAYAVADHVLGEDDRAPSIAVLPFAAALVLGVILLGSLPGMLRSPLAMLLGPPLVVVVPVAAALVGGLGWALLTVGWTWVWIGVGVLAALAVTGVAAHLLSSGFRVRYRDQRGWQTARITHGDAVATAWAAVYAAGFAYAGGWLAWSAWRFRERLGAEPGDLTVTGWTLWASAVAAGVIALVLVVLVFWLPARARVDVRRKLERDVQEGRLSPGPDDAAAGAALLARLSARGATYVYLTKHNGGLTLSDAGKRLAKKLRTGAG